MNILNFFTRKRSAPVARERLQILLAHERALTGRTDLAAILQEEILAVIAKHIAIDRDKVNVKLDRGKQCSTLEIDIEMPEQLTAASQHPQKLQRPQRPQRPEISRNLTFSCRIDAPKPASSRAVTVIPRYHPRGPAKHAAVAAMLPPAPKPEIGQRKPTR